MKRIFVITGLLITVTACDFVYGVRRSAPIAIEPEVACVESAIKSAPGVTSVRHSEDQGGRPLTWSGVQAPTVVHNFFYEGPGQLRAALQYTKDYNGKLAFWQSVLGINRVPPQEQINAARPAMLYIERTLESQCGLDNLSGQVSEWCKGVSCPAL